MIHPDTAATLHRWREVLAAAALGLIGLWIASGGGLILIPVGLTLTAIATALGLQALRRLRFAGPTAAPGLIEVNEGQISYLTAQGGGFVSVPDLIELRLVTRRGHRYWHLRQADGDSLAIPVDATGAEALFDAFTTLPGLDTGALVAALDAGTAPKSGLPALDGLSRPIWQRRGRGVTRR